MFEAFEDYRRLLDISPRPLRIALAGGSPLTFPLFAVGKGAFFLFSVLCLAAYEWRRVPGAIKDNFTKFDADSEAARRIESAFATTGQKSITYTELSDLTSLSDTAVRESAMALEKVGKLAPSRDGHSAVWIGA